jgi:site-specific recombinase
LDHVIRELEVQTLRAHLDLCRAQCDALAEEFESTESSLKRTRLAHRWDATLKRGYMMQLLLDLLERRNQKSLKKDPACIGADLSSIAVLRRRASDQLGA